MTENKNIVKKTKKSLTQEKNNILIKSTIEKWESLADDYLNFDKLLDDPNLPVIKIIESIKNTGKTMGSIAKSLKEYSQSNLPSILLRETGEEIKAFFPAFKAKYESGDFPLYIGLSGYSISEKGIFKNTTKTTDLFYKQKKMNPVLLFGSVNSITRRSSVPFPKNIYAIIDDELTNPMNPDVDFIRARNHLLALNNILRGSDPKHYLIFLNPNIEALYFYKLLKIDKEVKKIKQGESKILKIKTNRGILEIYFSKPIHSNNRINQFEDSDILKLSSLIGLDDYLFEGKALISKNKIPSIKNLGDFQFNLYIKNQFMGVFLNQNGILQITRRYFKTKPTYYFYWSDYNFGFIRGNKLFIKSDLEYYFDNNLIQIEDDILSSLLIELLRWNQGIID